MSTDSTSKRSSARRRAPGDGPPASSRPRLGVALLVVAVAAASLATGAASGAATRPPAPEPEPPPLLDGMGQHHHPIDTDDPTAQEYFDQGLVLHYGFNHREAVRSFREAARRDPDCAMCWWGQALSLGPNINAAMDPDDAPEAYDAVQKARELAASGPAWERAYVEALARRYGEEPLEDRSPRDAAYADAMRQVAGRFPDDGDALALFAEALMCTTPWDYWTDEGEPKPVTEEILDTLEAAVRVDPENPGANHLYIHTVEAQRPETGVPAAERLEGLVPGAGHLVHMPSHIYLRVGRYHEAAQANERAIEADRRYREQADPDGLYPIAYMPHNPHFLWFAASMEGRADRALSAARKLAGMVDTERMREPGFGTLQHYRVTPLYAMVRFARWDQILGHRPPPEDLTYPRAVWRYARGFALARTGWPDAAERELQALRQIAGDEALEEVTIWDINTTADLVEIAVAVLSGELAAERGELDRAVERLRQAVALQEALNYDEPPPWYYPVRHSLGAVLLEAGRAEEAESVYRADLERYPENGWSLYGLHRALAAQGRDEEAAEVRRRFDEAWRHADVTLTASRF